MLILVNAVPVSVLVPERAVVPVSAVVRSSAGIAWRIRVMRRIWYSLGYQILHWGRILHAKIYYLITG